MSEELGEQVSEETKIVVRSLNRLESSGYGDRWIADYLSEKTGQKVKPENIKKNDFRLRNGNSVGWRSFEWMMVK